MLFYELCRETTVQQRSPARARQRERERASRRTRARTTDGAVTDGQSDGDVCWRNLRCIAVADMACHWLFRACSTHTTPQKASWATLDFLEMPTIDMPWIAMSKSLSGAASIQRDILRALPRALDFHVHNSTIMGGTLWQGRPSSENSNLSASFRPHSIASKNTGNVVATGETSWPIMAEMVSDLPLSCHQKVQSTSSHHPLMAEGKALGGGGVKGGLISVRPPGVLSIYNAICRASSNARGNGAGILAVLLEMPLTNARY